MLFKSNKIESLLKLLDDPDPTIYEQIKGELMRSGTGIIPYLESHQLQSQSSLMFTQRVERLIDDLRFTSIHNSLEQWSNSDDKNLLSAFILLSQFEYPDQNEANILREINIIKQKIWIELNPRMTSFEQINVFNRVFFNLLGFTVTNDRYETAKHIHLYDILEYKKGTSIGLSIVYSAIAQLLRIPIYCVLLPNLTLLAYLDDMNIPFRRFIKNKYGVIFYINPTNEGSLHDDRAIEHFLKNNDSPYDRSCFEPCSNTRIIQALIDDLINNTSNTQKIKKLRLLKGSLIPSCNNIVANF